MIKLNHIAIRVRDWKRSRDWYAKNLGLEVEFEIPKRRVAGLKDDAGLTLLLGQPKGRVHSQTCSFFFEVDDVEAKYRELRAKGIRFVYRPAKRSWGYGAELKDPDGYSVCLWDEKTMKEKG
jgi:catechol 2,3-dioxygenase-like lactoylglutathione lyase family enzyme